MRLGLTLKVIAGAMLLMEALWWLANFPLSLSSPDTYQSALEHLQMAAYLLIPFLAKIISRHLLALTATIVYVAYAALMCVADYVQRLFLCYTCVLHPVVILWYLSILLLAGGMEWFFLPVLSKYYRQRGAI